MWNTYSSEFFIGQSTSEIPLLTCNVKSRFLEMNFQFMKQDKVSWNWIWWVLKMLYLLNPVFHQKLLFKEYWELSLTNSSYLDNILDTITLLYKLLSCLQLNLNSKIERFLSFSSDIFDHIWYLVGYFFHLGKTYLTHLSISD